MNNLSYAFEWLFDKFKIHQSKIYVEELHAVEDEDGEGWNVEIKLWVPHDEVEEVEENAD